MRSVILALLLALLPYFALSTIGVDLSSEVGVGTWQCLRNNGVNFAIARVYTEVGTCDYHGMASIRNARAAGVPYVDGYIYPCLRQDASGQIDNMLNCLASTGTKYGMIWLDIEGQWTGNKQNNANFIAALGARLGAHGVNYGVYTNANGWGNIVGGWNGMASRPLWWAYWDNSPSWSHWSGFGGWSRPAMKQYHGDTSLCGASVDLNFY